MCDRAPDVESKPWQPVNTLETFLLSGLEQISAGPSGDRGGTGIPTALWFLGFGAGLAVAMWGEQ